MAATKRACWLDCDPGHDDALALILAGFSPALELIGVSTVGGNVSVEKTTKNAAHMLHVLGLHETVPLYRGCATPLLRALKPCPEIHGDSGLGGKDSASTFPPLPEDFPWRAQHAVEGMWQRISCWHHYGTALPAEGAVKLPEGERPKVTLMATGALTNVALLLKTYPAITPMLEAVVLMGGGFTRGNTRPFVEFNMETDPEAAAIVFDAGIGHEGAPFAMTHHTDQLHAHEFATGTGQEGAVPAADPSKVGQGRPTDAAHGLLHGEATAAAAAAASADTPLTKGITHVEPAVPMKELGAAIAKAIGASVTVPGVTPGDVSVPVPVVMLPLEVTHTALVTAGVLQRINAMTGPDGSAPSRFAALIASLLVFFRDAYLHVEGMPDPPLHDPCAVAAVIDPGRFSFTHAHVFIDTHSRVSPGATVADLRNVYRLPSNARNSYVSTAMDVDWFWATMLGALEAANAACLLNTQEAGAAPPAAKKARTA